MDSSSMEKKENESKRPQKKNPHVFTFGQHNRQHIFSYDCERKQKEITPSDFKSILTWILCIVRKCVCV